MDRHHLWHSINDYLKAIRYMHRFLRERLAGWIAVEDDESKVWIRDKRFIDDVESGSRHVVSGLGPRYPSAILL